MLTIKTERESQFELLRLVAQFFIVAYHLLMIFVYPSTGVLVYKSLQIPLHIGVVLFILLSGYFGIKASMRGFVRLLCMMFVLTVPLSIVNECENGGGKGVILSFFFVSNSPYWFMKTYVYLYLLSPIVNSYLNQISLKNRLTLLISLLLIACYVGMTGFDSLLYDGKNVVNFILIYTIGNTLQRYSHLWKRKNRNWYLLCFLCLNALSVCVFAIWDSALAAKIFEKVSFSYCSIGLIISGILFFMWMGGFNIQSRAINYVARSSLVIYMLHCAPIILYGIISPITLNAIRGIGDSVFLTILWVMLMTTAIVVSCVIVYIILTPVWNVIDTFSLWSQKKWDILVSKIEYKYTKY